MYKADKIKKVTSTYLAEIAEQGFVDKVGSILKLCP